MKQGIGATNCGTGIYKGFDTHFRSNGRATGITKNGKIENLHIHGLKTTLDNVYGGIFMHKIV